MGGHSETLEGPDLAAGIAESELEEGKPIAGHAHGEAVLLVKLKREVWAIGAKCTHYGAPLKDGIVVGDTVRCPWHHACFSLRTGDPIRPPALNPVDVWDVERRDGRVRVTRKADVGRRSSVTAIGKPPRSVVILGAGAAGAAAAEMLRRDGYTGPVTLVSREDSTPYDRPNLSKDYLAGNAPEEWIPLRGREFYEEQGIALELGQEADGIDAVGRKVMLRGGRTLEYGALLYALGSEPRRLGISGADSSHVHYLRTLADSRGIIAGVEGKKRVAIVGSSFIGLEAAAALRTRGLEVTVIGPDRVPFERVLGAELGAMVQRVHEEHGVQFRLGRRPASIDAGAVVLDDGTRVPAELVLVGIGVEPSIELARRAGCTIEEGAIAVDAYLQTSVPGIFAAGDAARWTDARSGRKLRVEHWVTAQRMGQVAARNALGRKQRLGAVPFFWTAHWDLKIDWVGYPEPFDRVVVDGDLAARDAKISYLRAGKLVAVAAIGRDRASLEAELAFETQSG